VMAAIERARQRREDDERRIRDEQAVGRTKPQQSGERSRQDDRVCYVYTSSPHLMLGHSAFSVAGPTVWNLLTDNLQDLTHLFDGIVRSLLRAGVQP